MIGLWVLVFLLQHCNLHKICENIEIKKCLESAECISNAMINACDETLDLRLAAKRWQNGKWKMEAHTGHPVEGIWITITISNDIKVLSACIESQRQLPLAYMAQSRNWFGQPLQQQTAGNDSAKTAAAGTAAKAVDLLPSGLSPRPLGLSATAAALLYPDPYPDPMLVCACLVVVFFFSSFFYCGVSLYCCSCFGCCCLGALTCELKQSRAARGLFAGWWDRPPLTGGHFLPATLIAKKKKTKTSSRLLPGCGIWLHWQHNKTQNTLIYAQLNCQVGFLRAKPFDFE